MDQSITATTAAVLIHHLSAVKSHQLDELMLDYSDDAILMAPGKTFTGSEQIRAFFGAAMASSSADMMAGIEMIHQEVRGEYAFIIWKSEPRVQLGTDTFVIRDGKIIAQTYVIA